MIDYEKELAASANAPDEEKAELAKLVGMQKDIAIGGTAEDFVRHPFFKTFENQMNAMINDNKGEVASLLKKPGVTIGEVQAVQAGIDKIVALKAWINSKVIAGRVAKQAIEIYEQDTDAIENRIQEAIDKSQK